MLGCNAHVKAAFSGDAMNFGRLGVTPPSLPGEPSVLAALIGVPGAFSAIGSGATERIRVYSLNDNGSVSSTMCDESLPPYRNKQTMAL